VVIILRNLIGKLKSKLITLAVALSLLSANVMAAYGVDFLKALDAIKDEDYQEAISKLEKAIKSNSDSGLDKRFYGMVYGNYIPHYYLGQARYLSGDCEGAIDAWNESLKQGVITGLSEHTALQEGMTACAGELVDIPKLAGEATQAIETAKSRAGQLQALSTDFRDLGSSQLYQSEWVNRWKLALDTAVQSTTDLENRLSAAVNASDDTTIQAIKAEASQLADAMVSNMTQATNQLAAIRQQQAALVVESRNRARRELMQAVAAARAQEAVDANDQVALAFTKLMELADRGEGLPSDTPAEDQLKYVQDINNALRGYQVSVQDWKRAEEHIARRTPPAELKKVVAEYLAGNYEETIQLVDPLSFSDERARIQALLFRAAASYRLYILSGETATQSLQQAESDIREIKGLSQGFSPYIPAFSPKFLDLFRRSS